MKNKNGSLKAFTIIELMVSIFITMIVIASFYKLYDTSAKAERSSAIRVSVNLLGEQMLDTISDSVRFIGLNSKVSDFNTYPKEPNQVAVNDDTTIIRTAQSGTFQFLSPYGGPITKLKSATGTYPNCTFNIYNSAALNGKINSFYIHTQDGVFETKRKAAGTGYTLNYSNYEASFTTENFESAAKDGLDGTECKDVFPAGTLISGTDRRFTLKYDNGSLYLYAQDKTETDEDNESKKTYMVNFKQNEAGQTYAMPWFTIQYLIETLESTTLVRHWVTDAQGYRKDIIAVRFGFILTSTKDRNKVGTYTGDKITYCIFGDGSATDCEEFDNPNETVYVFRRVIYLSNHRLLKDSISK